LLLLSLKRKKANEMIRVLFKLALLRIDFFKRIPPLLLFVKKEKLRIST
jgi:hypothetical protein